MEISGNTVSRAASKFKDFSNSRTIPDIPGLSVPNLAKVGVEGSNPFARSSFSFSSRLSGGASDMTFGSVKSFMRALDGEAIRVDGAAETARFFVPSQDRRIELVTRGITISRRSAKPRARIRRFVRVS